MSKVNLVLDATMFDTFLVCPEKFNNRFNKNKVTTTKAEPLDKGSLIHVGKEAYNKALATGDKWEKAVDKSLVAVRVEAAGPDCDLSSRDVDRVLEVLEEHSTYWRIADQGRVYNAIEKPFSYTLYEDDTFRFIMIGKIDLVFSDNVYKKTPSDYKTYSRDFPLRRNTIQFSNYAYAMQSNILFVDRVGFQTSVKPSEKFKRVPMSYDPLYFEQWKKNMIKWFFEYYDCAADNEWPMNTTSCDKFNRICEYFEVCDTSGERNKLFKLETNFKTAEKWDVSKSLAARGD